MTSRPTPPHKHPHRHEIIADSVWAEGEPRRRWLWVMRYCEWRTKLWQQRALMADWRAHRGRKLT